MTSTAPDPSQTAFVSSGLAALARPSRLVFPIDSPVLLAKLIAASARTTPSARPPLRLTDLARFDSILSAFSRTWEHGTVVVHRDDTGNRTLVVLDVQLGPSALPRPAKKRKRPVRDEDADSATGDPEDEHVDADAAPGEDEHADPPTSPSRHLSRELREVYAILQRGTAKGRLLAERFRSTNAFEPVCPRITKDDCAKFRAQAQGADSGSSICPRVHFRPIIRAHTDPSLGHCSYLNTCYSEPTYALSPSIPPLPSAPRPPGTMSTPVSLPSGLGAGGRGKEKAPCRYLHYEVDWDEGDGSAFVANSNTSQGGVTFSQRDSSKEVAKAQEFKLPIGLGPTSEDKPLLPPQWINCDLRRFDYSVLGKFHVIMADPPWDIHMSLPYGTMTDDEMRAMPIPALQDEGLLFLWVTGRAMEVGRECLRVWGYTRVDEVVWIKTNQLQRVIRTGRTGHWLNHTKEHMLVAVKTRTDSAGNIVYPSWCNRGLDTDVIVSEVRETSRKPDEVYGLIERMCPGGRKIEIFGRKHNTRPGWLTLGNQLGADQLYEEDLKSRIQARYPERISISNPSAGSQSIAR
ncbi:MT-A70-domain-containing protein [Punctularia strigosozonata HHB-11173 SS5]|uniref:MT-A70-domain-containing protein n=1 Tax=Punctularia strigosozonata (strain HHB-11173) TaxID=741275 RepID=UPI000441725E|nr:MT-A70-domain-containing protein [Punctularia strigosozonata HHB-11173 SS5]EIN10332.1 MT-A70-domain-containing protein [Punctularia strigosozonata HHB-11173 SS5]